MRNSETFRRIRTLHSFGGQRSCSSPQRNKTARRGTPQTGRLKSKPALAKTEAETRGMAQSEALRLAGFLTPEDRRASLCASQSGAQSGVRPPVPPQLNSSPNSQARGQE